jgi:hypothetical protein
MIFIWAVCAATSPVAGGQRERTGPYDRLSIDRTPKPPHWPSMMPPLILTGSNDLGPTWSIIVRFPPATGCPAVVGGEEEWPPELQAPTTRLTSAQDGATPKGALLVRYIDSHFPPIARILAE